MLADLGAAVREMNQVRHAWHRRIFQQRLAGINPQCCHGDSAGQNDAWRPGAGPTIGATAKASKGSPSTNRGNRHFDMPMTNRQADPKTAEAVHRLIVDRLLHPVEHRRQEQELRPARHVSQTRLPRNSGNGPQHS